MTAVQGHTYNISENSDILRDTVEAVYGDVHLIERHTRELYDIRFNLQQIGDTVNRLVS